MLTEQRDSKPYVRWWWLSGPFVIPDIRRQLQWVLENGFGGVELAWIDPSWLEEPERSGPRPEFLSPEWSRLVAATKTEAQALGLGCDFTFGSAWPFGGSWLEDSDASKTFKGRSDQRLGGSWETAPREQMYVLDHLSASALKRYARPLLQALAPALEGRASALFCDSLEVDTQELWSPLLWDEFSARFGYRLEPYAKDLDQHPDVRYDYRKLRGKAIVREFYEPFTALCHEKLAYSRVQCHGAPADLLTAYAAVDVPESEALLFLPAFSRVAASAAAWSGKVVVSAEAFTCLHGFPGWDDTAEDLWHEERAGDLKLLGDSLFANGVNQLVWHGMPYRPADGEQEFYAAVHVGPDSSFAPSLPGLNDYFTQVCRLLREGKTYSSMGVYLQNEDAMMRDRIPEAERTPGANFEWEMRGSKQPDELQGFAPVWISSAFLGEARCEGGRILSRHLNLDALYVDCKWLDDDALCELDRLAQSGAPIILQRRPRQPGRRKIRQYDEMLTDLLAGASTLDMFQPLLVGDDLPLYWPREIDGELLLFFAHPKTKSIRYPLPHALSEAALPEQRFVTAHWLRQEIPLTLGFGPNDGVMIAISRSGLVRQIPLPRAREFGA